ncbi:hypothetical protein ABID20_000576 [Rhizobium alvei]
MSEQLSLLDWRPPAEILPFPLHRSHGATAGVARSIVSLDVPKRTGRLNTLRSQIRKRLTPLVGTDRADEAADEYLRMIRAHFNYPPLRKQRKTAAVILSMKGQRLENLERGGCGGEADAERGQGGHPLGGVWGRSPHPEPSEYDAARVRDGDDAA